MLCSPAPQQTADWVISFETLQVLERYLYGEVLNMIYDDAGLFLSFENNYNWPGLYQLAVDGYKRGMTDIDLAETLEMGTKCSEGSPQPPQNADTRGIGVSHSSEREERCSPDGGVYGGLIQRGVWFRSEACFVMEY